MVYLQLSQSYRDYNKVRIGSVTFQGAKVSFMYQIYKDASALADKYLTISEEPKASAVKSASFAGLGAYDSICKALIQYLVAEGIENGTVEVE